MPKPAPRDPVAPAPKAARPVERAAESATPAPLAALHRGAPPPDDTRALQRTLGNRVVGRILQRQLAPAGRPPAARPATPPRGPTGLPGGLRSGLERLSGLDLGDVRVHHDSPLPGQVRAAAFARGDDIHLGPGMARHLPHEGWHVVQQRQGRVRATHQMKDGPGNADRGLEHEADVMGARALALGGAGDGGEPGARPAPRRDRAPHPGKAAVTQCKTVGFEFQASNTHIYREVEKQVVPIPNDPDGKSKLEWVPVGDDVKVLEEDLSRSTGLSSEDHPGSLWVEHRRTGAGGEGSRGSRKVEEWYDIVKPVVEASSREALPARDWQAAPVAPGAGVKAGAIYRQDHNNRLVDATDRFKCEGDGAELEIVTFPVEDTADAVVALFKAIENYVKGLEKAPRASHRIVTAKGGLTTKSMKLTKVKNGYIGISGMLGVKARPQVTFSVDLSTFPTDLAVFTEEGRWREAKKGAATRAPLAKLATVTRDALGGAFTDMSDDAFGFLMFVAHIVITARHSAPSSLGKDLAALAPRTSLRTELDRLDMPFVEQQPEEPEEVEEPDPEVEEPQPDRKLTTFERKQLEMRRAQAKRKRDLAKKRRDKAKKKPVAVKVTRRRLAFTDDNMQRILQTADADIRLSDQFALASRKAIDARQKVKYAAPKLTIAEYFQAIRSERDIDAFLARTVGS